MEFKLSLLAAQRTPKRQHSRRIVRAIAFLLYCTLQSCTFSPSPISQVPKPDPLFELASTAGIDYQPLQGLLRDRQWQAADRETFQILLTMSKREAQGWLSQADVEALSCNDLHTIAQLWDYYSDRRFGFIRQQQIWESVGGTVGIYTPEIAQQFGDRVGWRKRGQWLTYDGLNFSDRAPEGHLPATTGNGVSGGVWNGVASITHRLKYCHVIDALASRQWVRADWETLNLFDSYLKNIESGTTFLPLGELSCTELKEVDRLWLKYSDNRFGLSVQKPILKATGNDPEELHWGHYAEFETAVGWRIDPREEGYNGADPKTIPLGHFPYRLGYSYQTFGSGFDRTWRLSLNPDCGFN